MAVRKLALALAAVGTALTAQQITSANPSRIVGWALYAAATVLMVFAVPPTGPGAVAGYAETGLAAGRGRALMCGTATVAAVAFVTLLSSRNRFPALALFIWMSSVVLGAMTFTSGRASLPARAPVRWSRLEVIGLATILLFAIAARVLWIDTLPPAYFGDEPRVGMFLRNTYRQAIPNFFTMGWNGWAVFGLSLQGMFAPLLGWRVSTLRLASAVFGSLTVGATYVLARDLFTRRTAIFAALILAVCRTAIDFSRLGVCHAQVMCFETFAFCCWWRGVNGGKAASYWWAGIGLGLCLLTYNAGDLVPLLWLGWLILSVVLVPRSLRAYWRGAVITAAGFLVVAYPWLHYITDHLTFGTTWAHWTIIARGRQAMSQVLDAWHASGAGAATAILWRQIWLTWLGFGVLPGQAYRELGYRGGGILDHVSAPLFVLGLGIAVSRRLRRSDFIVYWWLVTTIVGGVLTIDPPAYVRLVGLVPAVAILAALPLEALLRLSEALPSRARMRAAGVFVLAAALLAGAGWDNWRTYFVRFAQAPIDDASELVRRLKRLPADTKALLVGADHILHFTHDVNCEIFAFELPDRRVEDVPDPAHLLPLREPVTTPFVIVLGRSQATLTSYIRDLYPHTEVTDVVHGTDYLMFRLLRLQPDDITQRAGLRQTVYDDDGGIVSTAVGNPFEGGAASSGRHVLWTGSVYWPTDKRATMRIGVNAAQADTPIIVRLADSFEWEFRAGSRGVGPDAQWGGTADVSVTLPRGWQPMRIEARGMQGLSMAIQDMGRPLTRWKLRPEETHEGLSAVYQRNGETIARAVDSQLNAFTVEEFFRSQPVQMPFVAAWEAALRVVAPGTYEFEALGSGPYSVEIDGKLLCNATDVVPDEPRLTHAARFLAAGLHPLVAHWDSTEPAHSRRRIFQVFWKPPGGKRELIPPSAFLRPAARGLPVQVNAVALVPRACAGDCNGNGVVSVDELLTMVNIALGNAQPPVCQYGVPSGADFNVALILQAVNNALNGCIVG